VGGDWPSANECPANSTGAAAVKNNECTIYITTKRGWMQKYRKEESGWTQTGPNGIVRSLSAEQLLSHILPLLAGKSKHMLRVEADTAIRKKVKQPSE
jgi:hypothetical protein